MPLVLGGSSAAAAGYSIDNSCRFNDGDSAYLHFTQGTPTDNLKWTANVWFKMGVLPPADTGYLFSAYPSAGNIYGLRFTGTGNGQLDHDNYISSSHVGRLETDRLFRDPSAWYCVTVVYDSANGTAGDRMKMYINGTEETSFAVDTNPSLSEASIINADTVSMQIGRRSDGGYFDGYMAELAFCDGQAYSASDFGEFDSDSPTIWKPKDISGLTFGNNGCWLDFGDSADLGADVSGNGNDFTVVNLDATDQCVDTPTNNFCVMNSVQNTPDAAAVYSQGNTVVVTDGSSGDWGFAGTMAMSTGKWYYEHRIYEAKDFVIGIHSNPDYLAFTSSEDVGSKWAYAVRADGRMYEYDDAGSQTINTGWGSTFTTGAIISVYLDLDNNKIYWANDDVMMNSGTGIDVTDVSIVQHGVYYWCQTDNNSGESWTITPAFGGVAGYGTTAMSSPVADAEGYGKFEYDPSRGGASDFDGSAKNFLSLCTKNLGSSGG